MRGIRKNEGEQAWKVAFRIMKKVPAVGKAFVAIFWDAGGERKKSAIMLLSLDVGWRLGKKLKLNKSGRQNRFPGSRRSTQSYILRENLWQLGIINTQREFTALSCMTSYAFYSWFSAEGTLIFVSAVYHCDTTIGTSVVMFLSNGIRKKVGCTMPPGLEVQKWWMYVI